MGVEFKDAAQSLLGNGGQIIGVINEDPCQGTWHRTNAAHEFGQTLPNRGNAAVIGRAETECHCGLMGRICHTLTDHVLSNPRIG
jgi:hypothetical protein